MLRRNIGEMRLIPGYRWLCELHEIVSFGPLHRPRNKSSSTLVDWRSHFSKCYKVKNLSDEAATLLEPASCAIHGMDKLKMPFGSKVLLIGAGPTGLILAQLMKVRPVDYLYFLLQN